MVSCSARVSARLENSLPSGWMKSLYRSMSTIAVGPSVAEAPGEANVDMVAGGCGRGGWKSGWLDGKNEMEMEGLLARWSFEMGMEGSSWCCVSEKAIYYRSNNYSCPCVLSIPRSVHPAEACRV